MSINTVSASSRRIPLALKIVFSLFMAVLVPFYLDAYGPTNFLYFCDIALFFTLAALWLESPLLASMPAVGIVLPQMIWVLDFVATLVGFPLLGMTEYMFRDSLSLFARGLSLFHGWLPFLLVWMVYRLGYDRRAFLGWTAVSGVLLLISYFFMPAPPAPADNPNLPVNIDFVYGMSDASPQTWMPPNVYFCLLFVALPTLIYLPTHLVFAKVMPRARRTTGDTGR